MNKFSCESAQSISNFHLINNKYSGEMLIKAMKNIDFFLIIEGELLKSELLQIKKTLQQINIIEHFMTVENQAFQGIEHIIFESEARKKN